MPASKTAVNKVPRELWYAGRIWEGLLKTAQCASLRRAPGCSTVEKSDRSLPAERATAPSKPGRGGDQAWEGGLPSQAQEPGPGPDTEGRCPQVCALET